MMCISLKVWKRHGSSMIHGEELVVVVVTAAAVTAVDTAAAVIVASRICYHRSSVAVDMIVQKSRIVHGRSIIVTKNGLISILLLLMLLLLLLLIMIDIMALIISSSGPLTNHL